MEPDRLAIAAPARAVVQQEHAGELEPLAREVQVAGLVEEAEEVEEAAAGAVEVEVGGVEEEAVVDCFKAMG